MWFPSARCNPPGLTFDDQAVSEAFQRRRLSTFRSSAGHQLDSHGALSCQLRRCTSTLRCLLRRLPRKASSTSHSHFPLGFPLVGIWKGDDKLHSSTSSWIYSIAPINPSLILVGSGFQPQPSPIVSLPLRLTIQLNNTTTIPSKRQ